MPAITVEVSGESLIARADGSLYWPARSILFVADVHLGKAASFRAAAVPVPAGTTTSTLDRLGAAIEATGARRLVVLGDLWHAKEGRTPEIIRSLRQWRESYGSVEMTLVEGNHDRRAGPLPPELGLLEQSEPYLDGPFALRHYPTETDAFYSLAGHIHPAVSLRARGRQSLTLPCFWFGSRVGVLPSFGDFTGSAIVEPQYGDQVLVLADRQIHQASFAGELRNSGQTVVK